MCVYPAVIVRDPPSPQAGQHLRRKGLVHLDHVVIGRRAPGPLRQSRHRRHGSDPHDARCNPRRSRRPDPCQRGQSMPPHPRRRRQDQRRRPVVDPRRIARRDRPPRPEGCRQRRQPVQTGGPRMLVRADHRVALAAPDRHRRNIRRVPARVVPRLRPQRIAVLIGPRNPMVRRDILGGFRHRFNAISLRDPVVDKPPADRRVVHLDLPRKGRLRLRQHKGRAGHAFDPARDHHIRAVPNGPRAGDHRVQPAGAQPVQGQPRHSIRQP